MTRSIITTLRSALSPDDRLRQVSRPCTDDDDVGGLAHELLETLYTVGGIGLTAVQIGEPVRLCVIDLQTHGIRRPHVFINPEIIARSLRQIPMVEGCLSVPGTRVQLLRHTSITVAYRPLLGDACEEEFGGLLGHCLQHETDHMDGVLLTDRARLQAAEGVV